VPPARDDYEKQEWKVRGSREFKLYSLYFVTSLVVTFVRHGVRTHWTSLESVEQFFEYWLIYLIALTAFVAITGAIIFTTSQYFMGYPNAVLRDRLAEVQFHIVMTVLVVVVLYFILSHYAPSGFLDFE
jgi:hypothetical protein